MNVDVGLDVDIDKTLYPETHQFVEVKESNL